MPEFTYIDGSFARRLMPRRPENSNKGSFGRLLAVIGSAEYRGAAHLALEAALRGGVGYVTLLGESELVASLLPRFPECIYLEKPKNELLVKSDIEKIIECTEGESAVLVGVGSGKSRALAELCIALLRLRGAPLILDADAINSLALLGEGGRAAIREACREVILTPHPMELSRLVGRTVADIQSSRVETALAVAADLGVTLVLKGSGTVVTNGREAYVNTSGSSALAKAGSGDTLAGLLSALVAAGMPALSAASLAVYVHGAAADDLAAEYSTLGVTPSDLPKQMARVLATLQK